MGEKTDMNRANEVRPMFRRLADVAERTGCAVILIGHLNKAAGGQISLSRFRFYRLPGGGAERLTHWAREARAECAR